MVSAFVPTIGRSPVLPELLAKLDEDIDVDRVLVADNGMPTPDRALIDDIAAHHTKVTVLDWQTDKLYAMWNRALLWASKQDDRRLAILNDDLVIPPRMVGTLADALTDHDLAIVCPDYNGRPGPHRIELVQGTYRNGGICGFAFLVDAGLCPLIDERFRIWYGDDDLLWKIHEQGGRAGILRGLPVEHLGSLSVNSTPWAPAAVTEDAALWQSLGRPC